MVVLPEHMEIVADITNRELKRLQLLVPETDILAPSGKKSEDIVKMISHLVDSHICWGWSIDYAYNIPWLTQAVLKSGVTIGDLRIDNSIDNLYSANPDIYLPLTQSVIINNIIGLIPDEWIFNWFVRNIDIVCEIFYSLQRSVDSKRDILILSNHATWFNLPLIAHCLHRVLDVPQQDIYTILWPAITHSHWNMAGILRFSNAIKTYPDTPKAATGYEGSKAIQDNFIGKIDGIFKIKKQGEPSRILLLSPSGTTDKFTSDGDIVMSQPSRWTESLVKILLRRYNMLGFAIGVNDTEIIKPWHSRPRKGNVYTGISPVNYNNWKEIMPETILNQYWKSIWDWISPVV